MYSDGFVLLQRTKKGVPYFWTFSGSLGPRLWTVTVCRIARTPMYAWALQRHIGRLAKKVPESVFFYIYVDKCRCSAHENVLRLVGIFFIVFIP